MANSWFRFKQFIIYHDKCAMKVCTDSCILGSWFAVKTANCKHVLDIGSGSGLLMMMLAQKSNADIHGIEIDRESFEQLQQNIQQNDWHKRMNVFKGDVRSVHLPVLYDFIISNPPFFEKDLLSESEGEQVAKHSMMLSFKELIAVVDRNLNQAGTLGILMPYHRMEEFTTLAGEAGFYPIEKLVLRHTDNHIPFRVIMELSRKKTVDAISHSMSIRKVDGNYTSSFIELLKDYYLHM